MENPPKLEEKTLKALEEIQSQLATLTAQNEMLQAAVYRISLATPSNMEDMLLRIDRIIKNIELRIKRS